MSMTSADRTGRYIIEVIYPPDGKGYVAISLNKGEIPPPIGKLREINDAD